MTVCIASMLNWIYGPNDFGKVIVTVSDRQITAGDVEYEPLQYKVGALSKTVLILIAGDYATHSEAILHTNRQLVAKPENDPGVIAEIYASFIREINYRHATNLYLAPLGLDHESFHHKDLSPTLANKLISQLQGYQPEPTEALIVGTDARAAHIYVVDRDSRVACHNDVGFAAIGIGAALAKSTLMQAGYSSNLQYAAALALSYTAKKRAEVAPGVGSKYTDLYLVTRDGVAPVLPELITKTAELYAEFEKKRTDAALEAITKLDAYMNELGAAQEGQNKAKTETPEAPVAEHENGDGDD